MSDDLRPCPFCGSAITVEDGDDKHGWVSSYFAGCRNSGCFVLPMVEMTNRDDAITAWNRRASSPARPGEAPTPRMTMKYRHIETARFYATRAEKAGCSRDAEDLSEAANFIEATIGRDAGVVSCPQCNAMIGAIGVRLHELTSEAALTPRAALTLDGEVRVRCLQCEWQDITANPTACAQRHTDATGHTLIDNPRAPSPREAAPPSVVPPEVDQVAVQVPQTVTMLREYARIERKTAMETEGLTDEQRPVGLAAAQLLDDLANALPEIFRRIGSGLPHDSNKEQ